MTPAGPAAADDPGARIAQAVQFAGVLAEAGVREIVIVEPRHPPRTYAARQTDLPALILTLRDGATIRAEARVWTIERGVPRPLTTQ